MNMKESFSNSAYTDQMHREESELSEFIGAVTELFGPEQARLSAEDWLDESELMDSPPRSTSRDWRAVTVAARSTGKSPGCCLASSNAFRRID